MRNPHTVWHSGCYNLPSLWQCRRFLFMHILSSACYLFPFLETHLNVADFSLLVFCWGYLHVYSLEIQVVVFLWCLVWFGNHNNTHFTEWVGKFPSSSIFLEEFVRISVNSWNIWWIHQWSQLVLDCSLRNDFDY